MRQIGETVPRDGYYQIDVVWKDGFKHNIKCRGFNLKSMLDFQKSIFWIESYKYKQITEKLYNKETDNASNTTKEKSARGRKQKREYN